MLNKYLLTGTLAALCSASMLAAQQQPQSQQPDAQRPQTQQPAQAAPATQKTPTTTLVGCVYRERDVPGRAPNVAERVGVLEDYILMELPGATATAAAPGATSERGETASAAGAAGDRQAEARGTTGAAATAGAAAKGRMFKLEFVDDDRLQSLVGRRVQVTGQVDAEEGDSRNTAGAVSSTTDKIIGRDQVNLSEFEVSSITEVDGTCPTLTGGAQ